MANISAIDHDQLMDRIADGFELLSKQVEELKCHKEELETLLGRQHKSSEGPRSEQNSYEERYQDEAIDALTMLRSTRWKAVSNEQVIDEPGPKPERHQTVESKGLQRMTCPFASMTKERPIGRQSITLLSPRIHRPDSLPTPPETREQYIDDANAEIAQEDQNQSQISATDSVSKCPIRMLDERPPEEVAEYFETHKHEIPRSHEVCVKRYQKNEQSLRQLDEKYGSLVNMIQGLGMKHQPLLHDKDVVDGAAKPDDAIEQWADAHMQTSETAEAMDNDALADPEERTGYFDRPLKEVRVGESPSRPWGISVPAGLLKSEDGLQGEQTPGPMPKQKPSTSANPKVFNKQVPDSAGGKPQVVFNGPVFIGYTPDEAAAFLKKCGMNE